MSNLIESLPEKPKMGRPFGTTKPNAVCHNMEERFNRKQIANKKFKNSLGYIKLKIKMNCKTHNLEVPALSGKTLEELTQIHFDIKLTNFNNSIKNKKQ